MTGWLPSSKRTVRAVTAATAPAGAVGNGTSTTSTADVWKLWRTVGELHYSTSFVARQVGRLDWHVLLNDVEQSPDDSAALVRSVTGPDGPAVVTAAMALHAQVAGQYRYRLADDPPPDGASVGWQVTTPDTRRVAAGDSPWLVDVHTIRRDPADPTRADSPVLAAAPIAAELALLSALARSQARNRSSQRGVLLYPAEQTWEDEGPSFDTLLQQVLTAPLADEHAAAAVVPLQVPTPAELVDSWRLLSLDTTWDDDLPERIEHTTRRLALALDHPPEILLGVADVNHWTAWQVSEDTYRAHVEPLARWPAWTIARAIEAVGELPAGSVELVPDPAKLLQRSPTVADTLTAYQLGLVSAPFTRDVLGATEDDAGDGVDRSLDPALDDPDAAGDPGPPDSDQPRDGVTAAVDPDRLGDVLADVDAALLEAGRTAADLAVARTRERIGAAARTAVRADREASALIDGVPNGDVPALLGRKLVSEHVQVRELADDTVTQLLDGWWRNQLDRAAARVERAAGISFTPDGAAVDAAAQLLTSGVAAVALAGLWSRTPPAPPTDVVRRAMVVAGGGDDPGAQVAATTIGTPATLRSAGFARGAAALDAIRKQTGLTATRWRWRYGDRGEREQPHPGHVRLDGVLMANDGTARTIDPRTGDRWRAYPGDHKGCLCDAVPTFAGGGS